VISYWGYLHLEIHLKLSLRKFLQIVKVEPVPGSGLIMELYAPKVAKDAI